MAITLKPDVKEQLRYFKEIHDIKTYSDAVKILLEQHSFQISVSVWKALKQLTYLKNFSTVSDTIKHLIQFYILKKGSFPSGSEMLESYFADYDKTIKE